MSIVSVYQSRKFIRITSNHIAAAHTDQPRLGGKQLPILGGIEVAPLFSGFCEGVGVVADTVRTQLGRGYDPHQGAGGSCLGRRGRALGVGAQIKGGVMCHIQPRCVLPQLPPLAGNDGGIGHGDKAVQHGGRHQTGRRLSFAPGGVKLREHRLKLLSGEAALACTDIGSGGSDAEKLRLTKPAVIHRLLLLRLLLFVGLAALSGHCSAGLVGGLQVPIPAALRDDDLAIGYQLPEVPGTGGPVRRLAHPAPGDRKDQRLIFRGEQDMVFAYDDHLAAPLNAVEVGDGLRIEDLHL
nr:MAG TPA: hypothetical protein [Caudoviricetes sp.]